jgi:hypothetical protein
MRETGEKRSEEKTVTKTDIARAIHVAGPSLHTPGSSIRNFTVQPPSLPPPSACSQNTQLALTLVSRHRPTGQPSLYQLIS